MIILDTNVISELMRATPTPAVIAWLDEHPADSVWTTSISMFEIKMSLRQMPDGRRRDFFEARFQQVFREDLIGQVLSFDTFAADEAALLTARLRTTGQPIEFRDLFIAGIVTSRKAQLATRNVRHFASTGIFIGQPVGSVTNHSNKGLCLGGIERASTIGRTGSCFGHKTR